MIQKRTARELLLTAVTELLETRYIEQISVKDIAAHCGVSTRTFYNCFLDKHDALAHAYYEQVKPYMNADLRTWNDFRCEYYMGKYNFMRHALSYTGENCLANVILAVEREKYRMHIKEDLYSDPESLELIMSGINYMIYGNLGLLKESYKKLHVMDVGSLSQHYQTAWDMMRSWMPQIVRNSMEHEPVRPAEALPFLR
ncbi:MAG: TetR/AcrR family transcriptional regulator [Eubacteriales bacterium]|nr:TetR/AcrR family transcriptional regulator [Eubacteriales bacterium]